MSKDNTHDVPSSDAIDYGYEIQDIKISGIIGLALICILSIVISIIVLDSYFVFYKEKLLREANQYESTSLNELRAYEQQQLTTYDVVDKEKGIYKIPINRSMQILAEDAFHHESNQ